MYFFFTHKWLSLGLVIFLALLLVLLWQVLYITHHYVASVPAPTIPRSTERFGTGPALNFVVMGDSTSIGQGTTYDHGIARQSAQALARTHSVALTNVGISGARVADVRTEQLAKAIALKPDLVLLAIGANDVTHVTLLGSIRANITTTIDQMQAANPDVRIVLTGSPAMGSVARFAPPNATGCWLAGTTYQQPVCGYCKTETCHLAAISCSDRLCL